MSSKTPRTVGTAIEARIAAGMTVHRISSLVLPWIWRGSLRPARSRKRSGGHQDRPFHQHENDGGDPENRPEEVVDPLGERALGIEGVERGVRNPDHRTGAQGETQGGQCQSTRPSRLRATGGIIGGDAFGESRASPTPRSGRSASAALTRSADGGARLRRRLRLQGRGLIQLLCIMAPSKRAATTPCRR